MKATKKNLMEGSLKMKDPYDKKRILSRSEWRNRHCCVKTNTTGESEYVFYIYKEHSKQSENPKLLFAIPMTSNVIITTTNSFDEFIFTVDAGLQYTFSSNTASTRDIWVKHLKECIQPQSGTTK
jgi:hypothetical protein